MFLLYLRLIGARIRSQMQYKVSFWTEMLSFAIVTGLEFIVLVILFTRFPSVAGWSLPEIAILYGFTSASLGLAEMIGRGFDAPFELMMQTGTFDKILTRPQGTFFQILAADFQLRRLGRVGQGLAVLVFGLLNAPVKWNLTTPLLLIGTLCSGVVIYLALFVIGATMCFWTIKTPEVVNILTFGGDFMLTYPLSIYNVVMRTIFTTIIPLAFINYPTALALLGRTDPHGFPAELAWAAPLAAGLFFGAALLFWRFGVSKYTSSGS